MNTTKIDTAAEREALLPCPFCGRAPSDDLIDTLYPGARWREDDGLRHYLMPNDTREAHGRVWTMHCNVSEGGCGANVSGDTRAEAIATWNRRASAAPAPVVPENHWHHPERLKAWDEAGQRIRDEDAGIAPIDADKLHGEIRNLAAHGGMYLRERQYGFAETAFDKIIESIDAHRDARHAAAELVSLCATSKDGEQPTERRSITVSVGELRASDGTTYCVSLYKPGDNIGDGMCVLNTPNRQNAEDEAQAWREWLGIAGVPQCPKGKGDCAKVLPDKRCFDCPYGVNRLPGTATEGGNQ